MSAGAHLTIRPELCNRCNRCVPACPECAVKVGASYVYIDTKACTMCCACVEACETGAITRGSVSARAGGAQPGTSAGDVSKVVVGSRAEAKALRKAAAHADKVRAKPAKAVRAPAHPAAASATTPRPAAAAAASVTAPAAEAAGASVVALPARTAPATPPPAEKRAPVSAEARSIGGPPPGAATWTLLDAAVALAVMLVAVLAKDRVLALRPVSLMPAEGRALLRACVLVVYYSLQLGAFAWLASRHGAGLLGAFGLRRRGAASSASATTARRPSVFGSLGLVIVLFVGTEAFSILYGLGMQALRLEQPVRLSSDLSAVFGAGGVGMVLSVVLVALVAPFVEELAFRGIVLGVAGERISVWPAIILSAAIYGAYHLDVWLFVPTMVLGLALGWLAWTRRSLWPAIALHVLYNAAAVAASYVLSR